MGGYNLVKFICTSKLSYALQSSKGKKVGEIMSIIHIWKMAGDGDMNGYYIFSWNISISYYCVALKFIALHFHALFFFSIGAIM